MEKRTQGIIDWIKEYFVRNGPDSPAVIGISGGKDSTVVGKLLCEALGPDKVIAVKMPQGKQHDIDISNKVIEYLGIPKTNVFEVNIGDICDSFYNAFDTYILNIAPPISATPQVTSNLPARVRMTVLYAIAARLHGRVANTCNRSENYVGYSTKFGDAAGDFSPLHEYTVCEVLQIGRDLGIPMEFLEKIPEDGLSGLTDEDNLGFTYAVLDDYLLNKIIPEYPIYKKIEEMNERNKHKLRFMPIGPLYNKDGQLVRRHF